jgi:hypothetical protein
MNKIKQRIYQSGTSSVWLENEQGFRTMVASTYQNEEFALALKAFIDDYYSEEKTDK